LTQLAGLTGRVALRSSRELSAASDRDVSLTIALEEGSGVLAALIAVALGAGLLLGSGGSAAAGDRGDLEGLEGDLRAALASGSLTVHYQPQVDARDGAPVGAEALVRWRSPKRGDVPPARFVALAERSDLIRQLGTFVLGAACQQAAEWLRAGLLPEGFRVWVNVSARQLTSGDLAAEVDRLLGETGLPAARLGLEVTETSVVEAGDGRSAAAATLERVRARGVLVAIDDFGTGYSSMAQLKRLPVDALKIDRAFVGDLGGSRTSEAIVENILRLGAALGLEVVAEGIETERQLAALRRLGCRFAQGYLFGRPAPADDLTGALAAARTGRLAA
jgi:EAL domain-containing protein (putative c-di-GMP-specific phosphodiesterase class I)